MSPVLDPGGAGGVPVEGPEVPGRREVDVPPRVRVQVPAGVGGRCRVAGHVPLHRRVAVRRVALPHTPLSTPATKQQPF